jgi:DNA helicase-2/ATP-dependent DNA helicase PcrA
MNELEQHPLNSEKRKEIIERMVLLKNMLENGCINELKVFFKPFLISPVNLYKLFLGNIEKYIQLNSSETEAFKSRTLKMIKKGIIPFEDSASICFFSLLYKDNSNYGHVKHVVIDEAQDYSLFQFDILRTLFSKSKFSIFGDLAQAIYSHRSIKSWEEVNELIFTDDCKISYLQKSYRTTMEITNGANYILRNLNLATAEPVIRSGSKIGFNECANDFERNQFYLQKINNFIESDYKSIGIICKDESEMHRIRAILIKLQIPYNYVTNSDISYNGGISLLTSPLAKGLEFDAVIINNASSTIYNPKSEIDMRLLYIAMTRPLHELEILYTGQLNTILQEVKNSNCKSENQEFNLAKRKKL